MSEVNKIINEDVVRKLKCQSKNMKVQEQRQVYQQERLK